MNIEKPGLPLEGSDRKHLIDLIHSLPDHWSIMRVSRAGGETWRVYDNARNLVADADDLETALNLALT